MTRRVAAVAAVLFLFAGGAPVSGAEEAIKKGEVLSLEAAIAIALKNHPSIIAAAGAVGAGRGRVGQAEAGYYPQLDATSSYNKKSAISDTKAGRALTATSQKQAAENPTDDYAASVALKQTILDFGKTSGQVGIQIRGLEGAVADLEKVKVDAAFGVKKAYYAVLQALRNADTAKETVRQATEHLTQARGFFETGKKSKFDVTKALVDLSSAKLTLLKAENAVKVAVAGLNNSMGLIAAPEYKTEDRLGFARFDISLEEAVKGAYIKRQDLKSVIAKEKASEESIEVAKKGYYPSLTGNASYNWSGGRFPLDEGWVAGVTVNVPLFSGFLTKYQVAESRENLNAARANREQLKQGIFLEVETAFLNLRDAEERIPAAEVVVKEAEENLELANERYKAGVGSPVEVTDAEIQYSTAKTGYNQALYDYKVAEASLQKAMGLK